MKRLIDPKTKDSELKLWLGAKSQIYLYHVSLRRLALRVSVGGPEDLFIVAVGCKHIAGPFDWESAHLLLEVRAGETLVVDVNAGFELLCSDVVLARGPSTDLDQSFEHFLGEERPSEPQAT